MSRLLSADFARLFKNKYFWICSIFIAGFGVFMQVMNYVSCVSNNTVPHPDTIFFSFSLLTGILLSAFISLFIGTDYSDGTHEVRHLSLRTDHMHCRRITDVPVLPHRFSCLGASALRLFRK